MVMTGDNERRRRRVSQASYGPINGQPNDFVLDKFMALMRVRLLYPSIN